jgi:uncharacterized protein
MNPASYYVRGTFTAHNLDFARDARHLIDLGFESFSLEPVVGGDPDLSLKEEHLPVLTGQYEQLADIVDDRRKQGHPVNFFHFNLELNRGPCLAKRLTGCGAGVEYLAVTPAGDIYPCHQLVGQPQFKMGDVRTGLVDANIRNQFVQNTIVYKECRSCWSRFYCGGGCHAAAYYENQNIAKPSRFACQLHQKRMEFALYLAAKNREV